jgi:hydrogenase-1 operon protein HyaE
MNPSSPALQRLLAQPGVQALSGARIDEFASRGTQALFFTGDPGRHPEIDDVAVILPELMRAFDGRFGVGVVDPDADREALMRWDAGVRPTLVFVRDGVRLGAIARMRDWAYYLSEIAAMLGGAAASPT